MGNLHTVAHQPGAYEKAKIIFDIYIRPKATAYVQAEIESGI